MQSLLQNVMMKFIRPDWGVNCSWIAYCSSKQWENTWGTKQNRWWNKSEMSLWRSRFVLWKAKKAKKETRKLPEILCNYHELVSYLQSQLLSDKFFWACHQYIHPKKRLVPGSTSAVSYIALNIGRLMKNCLQSAFFPFRNCWRFMCLNMHSMVSLLNQINSTRLVQKLFMREGIIIFENTTFALGICT